MNCIHPIAPAELGPMLRPKFDSTLLIAASTCQRIPYAAPARCQRPSSCVYESAAGVDGGVMSDVGRTSELASFGVVKLGNERVAAPDGTTANVSARAVPATTQSERSA